MSSSEPGISIGALSRATGIPVGTLRTWEHRYGYPASERRPSGHRRYPLAAIDALRRIRDLLEQGYRPSDLLPERSARSALADEGFDALARTDAAALDRLLHTGWSQHGCVRFLDEHLAPFLVEIGRRWAAGELGIGEEHFCSEGIARFLSEQRRAAPRPGSPVAVCAALSGERHTLGLHMAATTLALAGWDVRFLGADTPASALAAVARGQGAEVVCVGTSEAAEPEALAAQLVELQERLGRSRIWLGGARKTGPAAGVALGLDSIAALAREAELTARGRPG